MFPARSRKRKEANFTPWKERQQCKTKKFKNRRAKRAKVLIFIDKHMQILDLVVAVVALAFCFNKYM